MQIYVRIYFMYGANYVVEVIQLEDDQDIYDWYTPEFIATLVNVTDIEPKPDQWWTYDGTNFYPPAG